MAIRPVSSPVAFETIVDYFLRAKDEYLLGMGVERARLFGRAEWLERLTADLGRPDPEKEACFVLWEVDGAAVGHSNINKILYENEAFIHLHLWPPSLRRQGRGTDLFKQSAALFMERFKLRRLICEPFAGNPAPNRVVPRAGFRFIRSYRRPAGGINYEQEVNRYELELPPVP
jgi:RimJ/RimL family protein N-acetyltransferase